MRIKEACGCVHDGHEWLKMCEPCTLEFNERHVQAAIDHAERQPAPEVSDEQR
jgi:hypothetical protein